jgi:hypothetical protein
MSAVEALKAARAAGVELALDGDDLALKAASAPSAAVLDALSRHKAEIMVLLRPAEDGWSAEDWQVFFEERAGIVEFDGGLPRAEAEAQAFARCVVEWLNRNPERSPAGRCLGCGDREHAHDPLLPYGVEPAGHVWLHSRCRPTWYAARKAKAASALAAMGIMAPVIHPMEQKRHAEHPPSDATRELSTAKKPICLPAANERRLIHVEHHHREAIASTRVFSRVLPRNNWRKRSAFTNARRAIGN